MVGIDGSCGEAEEAKPIESESSSYVTIEGTGILS